jgi:mannose-6-phosphate isomerase-like protein (cupin superfamily)
VLSGTLAVHIADDEHLLEPKDSIYFDSTVPHAYRRSAEKLCCAVIVTTG